MNVLILAASRQAATMRDGDYPSCLTEVDGVPLIERLVTSCAPLAASRHIVALRAEDAQRFHLDSVISILVPNPAIVRAPGETAGAACSALLAIGEIGADEELLILSSNELLDVDFGAVVASFRQRGLDAGVITFPSIHPRYSYVRLGNDGHVAEAAEKKPISRNAVASFFWFARGSDFVNGARNMIRKDAHVEGRFFVCPVLNELILDQRKVGVYPLDARAYHPLKTERQMDYYETMKP